MKNLFWPILFVLIIVETIAMALIENSVKLHTQHYIFGIFMYAVVSYLFYNLYSYFNCHFFNTTGYCYIF